MIWYMIHHYQTGRDLLDFWLKYACYNHIILKASVTLRNVY